MATTFHRVLPGVPIVRGDGNALPLADSSHDLITYAQSWQWTDTPRSVPEAARPGDGEAIRLAGLTGLRVARRHIRWQRTVPLDTHLANISSRSAFLVLDQAANHNFLAEERTRLRAAFPDEAVAETYVVDLLVAARP